MRGKGPTCLRSSLPPPWLAPPPSSPAPPFTPSPLGCPPPSPCRFTLTKIPAMNVPLAQWEADGGARFDAFLEGLGASTQRAFKDAVRAFIRASRVHTST